MKPKLLLLDEPAAGLGSQEIAGLDRLILDLKKVGITILLVEHHMELVMAISDWVTVLDYGCVIAGGKPAEIQNNKRVIEAYLGEEITKVA
jgi:branched-chain amino acid transport system permease protein